jgi:hypothetical protein
MPEPRFHFESIELEIQAAVEESDMTTLGAAADRIAEALDSEEPMTDDEHEHLFALLVYARRNMPKGGRR